jgi:hypothetical protein
LVYKTAFPGEASPTSPLVNVEVIAGFDMSYSCRGGMKGQIPFGGSPRRGSSSGAGISSGSYGLNLESLLMGFVQSMQSNQQQMIQIMAQPQTSIPPRSVTTLASLEDRSLRQAGHMGFEPPFVRSRTGPLFEELPDSPPSKAAAPAPAGAAAATAICIAAVQGAVAPAVSHAPEAPEAPVDSDEIADLFGMLQERKEDAKVKAQETKAAKAKAKALAMVGAGLNAVVAVEAPQPAKHGKTRKKGRHTKKGKQLKVKDDKTPEVCVALAKAEAVAKSGIVCKAKTGAKALVLAKAGAVCEAKALLSAGDKAKLVKAKTDKKRKLDASDGWGCSKCRWAVNGCSQCKSETFVGFRWNSSMQV